MIYIYMCVSVYCANMLIAIFSGALLSQFGSPGVLAKDHPQVPKGLFQHLNCTGSIHAKSTCSSIDLSDLI